MDNSDNRDYQDNSDQDYEYHPRYQRCQYRHRPECHYKRQDPRISNYWFSFGAKGKSKTNLRSESDTNIYGQKFGHKLERTGESGVETGLSLGEGKAEFNNKAASKGTFKAAGRFDTALGSGSGKTTFDHDVAGETRITWD